MGKVCNGKKHYPYPPNEHIGAQSNNCGHAEAGAIAYFGKKGLLNSPKTLTMNIDWGEGPYPCLFCARILCEVMLECDTTLVFCNEDGEEGSLNKDNDSSKCESIKEATNKKESVADKCDGYNALKKKIDDAVSVFVDNSY